MATPKPVAEPHKELRFTRANQAQPFYVLSAIFFLTTLMLIILLRHPDIYFWMIFPPLLICIFLLKIAVHCTQHAYLILSPLGIEVFPFFKPEKNLQLRYWNEFTGADFNEDLTTLKLHTNTEQTAGLILSLKPITEERRPLLEKAMRSRLSEVLKNT